MMNHDKKKELYDELRKFEKSDSGKDDGNRMKTFLTPIQYNEIYSESTGILINGRFSEEKSILMERNKELTRKLLIFSDDLDRAGNELFMQEGLIKEMKELLALVVNDDGSRYNRPSYYYRIQSFLKEMK
jgi:hypothetical protein